jgi:predicted membrane-bound spermidine synthase
MSLPLLILIFALSGAAGLIYESIWSRYLSLFVGHSAYAQVIVLVIFLGGMALGAVWVGRRSDRIRDPLLLYALVEAVVGVIGLAFHALYGAATELAYDRLFPALAGPGLLIVKWGLAGLLILPQSILLGATFPLMSAGVLRRFPAQPGRVLAMLYFANSIGAAIGVLVAGFHLVRVAGLPGTLVAAAIVNLVVAAAVLVVQRVTAAREPAAAPAPSAIAASPAPSRWRLLLAVSFGTAVASFVYEIAWIRMLSLVLGSATHAFELMLSAFILGLALGAFWVRSRADRFRDPLRALGVTQCVMGALALLTLPIYVSSFHWMADLMAAFARTAQGYLGFNVARYALCLAVMLPATFCAGVTLPLITRVLLAGGAGERAIGAVYGANTVGSIVGAALAGLVLMPAIGLKALLMTGAALDVGLGLWLLAVAAGASRSARARVAWAAAAALLVVALVPALARFDRLMLSSGVYRFGQLLDPAVSRLLFYRDGRTATVSVWRDEEVRATSLATNGKPDASLHHEWLRRDTVRTRVPLRDDESTQLLLGLVTLAHAPQARDAAVIGLGSGMTSHVLLGSPRLERLVTIEIEPEMVRAARAFLPANRRVFQDPRSALAVDDAKSFFAAHRRRFDLIVSEPSNPWVSGVSGLFTTEFYRRVGQRLSDDGVFGQWLHLYEIDDDLVLSVLAAIHRSFRDYEIFLVASGDLLVVATNRRGGLPSDWSVAELPGIADDLRHVRRFHPATFEAMRVGNRAAFAPLLESEIRPNSDYFPVLDLGSERTRFLGHSAAGFLQLNADRFALLPAVLGRRLGFGGDLEPPTPRIPRVAALTLGARMRAGAEGVRGPEGAAAADALFRRRALDAVLATGTPPADWRVWLRSALRVEQDVHGGTAGVADPSFYGALGSYMGAAGAPSGATSAVRFVHGLAAWDFADAAHEADRLIAAAQRGERWLPNELLGDGATIAKLMTGDVPGARRALDTVTPWMRRPSGALRARLIASYVAAMERAAAGHETARVEPQPPTSKRVSAAGS